MPKADRNRQTLDNLLNFNEKNIVSRHPIPERDLETWTSFYETCEEISVHNKIGKVVGSSRYMHLSVLLYNDVSRVDVDSLWRVYSNDYHAWNIVRVNRAKHSVALLSYPEFEITGHPSLMFSVTVQLEAQQLTVIDYRRRKNKPVLHRKELFVHPGNRNHSKYRMLTIAEDEAGLLSDPLRIGYCNQWNQLLIERNFSVDGHTLRRFTNDED